MLTDFGKFLQKYRLNNQITQKDLAKLIGITPAFLSYTENGHKHLPLGIENKIACKLALSDELKEELNKASDKTRKLIILRVPDNETDQYFLGDLCRHLDTLTTKQKLEIRRLLNEV